MSDETFPVANVGGKEVPFDADQLRMIQQHPCFSDQGAETGGYLNGDYL